MKRIELKIDGMSCQNCVGHVTKALQKVAGVDSVEVSLPNGTATVMAFPTVELQDLINSVEEEGYTASFLTTIS